MKTMFSRSEEKFQVKYTNYQGNSKTYKAILVLKPYDDHVTIVKSECVGHVEKRISTRNAKKTQKRQIDRCTYKKTYKYYVAIRRNINSVMDMKQAIWAILEHLWSTDETSARIINIRPELTAGVSIASTRQRVNYSNTHPPLHPDRKIFNTYLHGFIKWWSVNAMSW